MSDAELELMTKTELIAVIRNFQRTYAEREKDREFRGNLKDLRGLRSPPGRDIDQISDIKKKSVSNLSLDSKFETSPDDSSMLKYKALASFFINNAIDEARGDLLFEAGKILNQKFNNF